MANVSQGLNQISPTAVDALLGQHGQGVEMDIVDIFCISNDIQLVGLHAQLPDMDPNGVVKLGGQSQL